MSNWERFEHNECRQLAEASSDLMSHVVEQLIGDVLQAQGEAIQAKADLRKLQRIVDTCASCSHYSE